jgi:hypothetical protein
MGSAGRLAFFGVIGKFLLRALYALGVQGSALDPLNPWTKYRAAPPLPSKSFRAQWKEQNAGR